MPNHRMKAGTRVRLGTDMPTATIGSKNQCTVRKRAMAMPRVIPTTTAMAKPAAARKMVSSVSWTRVPSATWPQNVTAMVDSGGRKKKGTSPLRATSSQSTATSTSEYTPARMRLTGIPLLVPAQHAGADPHRAPVGHEGHRHEEEDGGEHVVVDAEAAVAIDQVADSHLGGDQLDADH